MNNHMIALMASVGTQLKGVLPESKDKIVKTVCAGVLATAMGAGVSPVHAADESNGNLGQTAIGAAIGGVAGWGVGKIFGAGVAARNVMAGVGAAAGGVIANVNANANAAAKEAPAAAQPQAGLRALDADRALRVTQLQTEALSKRMAHQSAVRTQQDAVADYALNRGNIDFANKAVRAEAEVSKRAKPQDEQATRDFVSAIDALRAARYDVSAYAAAYGKLKQKFDVNDQSYAKLAETVTKQADVKPAVDAEARVAGTDPAQSGMAP